mmetsp:Transcript_44429/g.70606  ORF Transcript_44429/g.70606 Transcript_44429/m.70606 type:complete len:230 (+) Transcript_44429:456-1145(+)
MRGLAARAAVALDSTAKGLLGLCPSMELLQVVAIGIYAAFHLMLAAPGLFLCGPSGDPVLQCCMTVERLRHRKCLAHHLSQGTGGANIALRQHVLMSLSAGVSLVRKDSSCCVVDASLTAVLLAVQLTHSRRTSTQGCCGCSWTALVMMFTAIESRDCWPNIGIAVAVNPRVSLGLWFVQLTCFAMMIAAEAFLLRGPSLLPSVIASITIKGTSDCVVLAAIVSFLIPP